MNDEERNPEQGADTQYGQKHLIDLDRSASFLHKTAQHPGAFADISLHKRITISCY